MDVIGGIHKIGNTVILVTHEEDIALRANRIIRLFDGMVDSDTMNKKAESKESMK